MPPLHVLMKPASSLCNMSCDYCFYCDEAKNRSCESYGMMSEKTLKNVIRKTMLRAEGMITYVYQGGEPTLRGLDFFKNAINLQKQYNKNHIQVSNALQTNGYAIDEKWCEFFKEHNFLIGVSIDGTPEIHDTYRHCKSGSPTYDRIHHTTKLLDQYNVEYNVLTVVTQKTAVAIKDIYNDYKRNGWKYQQYIACLDPLNEVRGQKPYALKPEQYGQFLVELFSLWYNDLLKHRQPYIRQFENYIGILNGYPPESCEQNGTCGIQTVVEADGSVYPCDFYTLDEYRLGNFNENQLDIINKNRSDISFIDRSKNISTECKYYALCRGGCQRNRDFISSKDSYHNYFCESYKFFFGNCLDRMTQIKI